MPKITIICLIYKSIKLMDAVWESAHKYTPMLRSGEAEFLFVANDPTDAVINHLINKNYNFVINNNKHYSEDDLFKQGYGIPEYISRVYKGYNQGILNSKSDLVVLINSDNFFSENWLENLLKYKAYNRIVSSQIVERAHPKFGVFPGAIEHYFGDCIENYQEEDFVEFAKQQNGCGLKEGGAYMPCLLYRDVALLAGLYPEGNIACDNKREIVRYGDEFFYDKLKLLGVQHYTARESLVYHLKEGEKEETIDSYSVILPDEKMAIYEKYETSIAKNLYFSPQNSVVFQQLCNDVQKDKCRAQVLKSITITIYKKVKISNKTKYYVLGIPIIKIKYDTDFKKYYIFGVQLFKCKKVDK